MRPELQSIPGASPSTAEHLNPMDEQSESGAFAPDLVFSDYTEISAEGPWTP